MGIHQPDRFAEARNCSSVAKTDGDVNRQLSPAGAQLRRPSQRLAGYAAKCSRLRKRIVTGLDAVILPLTCFAKYYLRVVFWDLVPDEIQSLPAGFRVKIQVLVFLVLQVVRGKTPSRMKSHLTVKISGGRLQSPAHR